MPLCILAKRIEREGLCDFSKVFVVLVVALAAIAMVAPAAMAKKPSVEKWKPAFDYSGAKYKIKVSNVSHPAIKGVYAGFAIRDCLVESHQRPDLLRVSALLHVGRRVEVLNQLQMGAIQGMAVSSVASTNLGPRMGLVNLPFLVNSYEKLDKFIANKKLFQHFLDGMEHQGIMGLDVTAYGRYGWATTVPVKSIADAKKVKFRIAEAAVNKLLYKSGASTPWSCLAGRAHRSEAGRDHRSGSHPDRVLPDQKNSRWPRTSPPSTTPKVCSSGYSTRPGSSPCRLTCKTPSRRWSTSNAPIYRNECKAQEGRSQEGRH